MSIESKKMDTLLALRGKGYNLKDTEDPAVLSMDLGGGYTLLASVKREWLISFNDGVQTSTYQVDSVKVPYINAKDALSLYKEFSAEFEGFTPAEEPAPPVKKKPTVIKKKAAGKVQEMPGMKLPIVYPSELVGSFMRFKQWTANNNVIPEGSEVVVLNENEHSFRVSIPKAHISFDIKKEYVEVEA